MIDVATRAARLDALRARMAGEGIDLAAIAPTDNLLYLLGFASHYDERPCLLLLTATGAAMLMPALNADEAAAHAPEIELVRWGDADGPEGALGAVLEQTAGAGAVNVAADPEMRADHLMLLQAALPAADTVSATLVVGPLREAKSPEEIALLQASADLDDRAMRAAFAACAPGVAETEVHDALVEVFRAAGAVPGYGIVGGGANSAYPHHHTGARPLQIGDAVVIDIGAHLGGYVSDMTRMAFVGEPSERYLEVHAIVEDAGYGEYFTHRTGHGLGLSVHEPPWIMAGNDTVLRPGVVHSIEPGIYLPGEFGIRLEEIVHVTETGCERFSSLPRDAHVVAV